MKFQKIVLALTISLLTGIPSFAGTYTIKKGGQKTVNCTATAPAGYIDHAFFSVVDPEDAQYLGINYNSADCQATYFGLKAKSNIKVEVLYTYSYRGSYDNNMHVGHGSYYDYVTVTGAPDATSVKFREGSSVKFLPGKTVTLHIDFYPAGSEGVCNMGPVDGFGKPFIFDYDIIDNGSAVKITAKRTGWMYFVAMLGNDQSTAEVITVECTEDIEIKSPDNIKFENESIEMNEGDVKNIDVIYSPHDSYSPLSWTSANEKIATVDENGSVTALAPGETVITASTENKLKASLKLRVLPSPQSFDIISRIPITFGYTYRVVPTIYPADAKASFTWKSSDTSVATVSSTGVITGKNEGTAEITVKCKETDSQKVVRVDVSYPKSKGCEHRNAAIRVQSVKSLFSKSIITN